MKQKQLGVAIRKFTTAVTEQLHDKAVVAAAVGTLIQTLAKAAQDQATQVASKIIDRLTRQEERMDEFERKLNVLQRHIEAIDVRLDEVQTALAELSQRERAVGE